jgi:hypothetical protein
VKAYVYYWTLDFQSMLCELRYDPKLSGAFDTSKEG